MTRDTTELCRHALNEFAFLTNSGFSESHEIGTPHFSIDFTHIDVRNIAIGAFLPRYEYYVSLTHGANRFGLDELMAARQLNAPDSPNWTWAHSDDLTFRRHISYSAGVLHGVLQYFLNAPHALWSDVLSYRADISAAQHNAEQLKQADSAFANGRWGDAIAIYESASELTPVQSKRLGIAKELHKVMSNTSTNNNPTVPILLRSASP